MIHCKLVKCRGGGACRRISFVVFLSLSAVTAQSDHRLAGTSSSVPTTQCQVAAADPESVADRQRGRKWGGGWTAEGAGSACSVAGWSNECNFCFGGAI